MDAELVLAPEAASDLECAYSWYAAHRAGLGEEFMSCVEACLNEIRRLPETHALVYKEYRRALIRRFPYSVFYRFDGTSVVVVCIFHTSRDPLKWRERLT